ncbi:MAG TPA: 2OG-Fe(II) oxygenase [Pyrinomonadaceae bacterium]|nr:2OG-Fe(II) oxygenase [Pyrinomonadaceae bacterium]
MVMSESELIVRFGVRLEKSFFDEETCAKIIAEMRRSRGGAATVYGAGEPDSVDRRFRSATRIIPSATTATFVKERLWARRLKMEEHFRLSLCECEEPQFLRYAEGDFFVAHQDGNTGLLKLDSDRERRVSLIVFLNRQMEEAMPGAYCGGSLVFSSYGGGPAERLSMSGEPGTLVAFRAETTHEVKTVTGGERFTIACWYK